MEHADLSDSVQSVLKQILTTASPSEGWGIFNKYYQPQAAAEISKLTQQQHSFRIEAYGTPQSYFGRLTVLRSQLAFSRYDFQRHRRSSPLSAEPFPRFRMCVVCFHPIYSERQDVWTYQPGSHRRKVIEAFSTFLLRCLP